MPNAKLGWMGLIARDTSTGCPTFNVPDALTDPKLAVMVALPSPELVAKPALLTLATLEADELQLTALLRFCVLPSVYVPVAVNC